MHHRRQDGVVQLVEWVHRVMTADDGHVPDPDHVVAVANVGPSLGGGVLRAEILCFESDQPRAVEIIDEALARQRD